MLKEEITQKLNRIKHLNDQLEKYIKYKSYEQAKDAKKEIEFLKSQLPENSTVSSVQPITSSINSDDDIDSNSTRLQQISRNLLASIEKRKITPLGLSDLDFFRWVLKDDDMAIDEFPNGVATDGNGPFKLSEFDDLIRTLGIDLHDVGKNFDVVILGRNEWSVDNLNKHIENRRGGSFKSLFSRNVFCSAICWTRSLQRQRNTSTFCQRTSRIGILNRERI